VDANGQNFRMLCDASHWRLLEDPSGLEYDHARGALRLAHQRREVTFTDNPALAEERLLLTPQTQDNYGNRARLDDSGERIVASGLVASETEIYRAAEGAQITDIAMGYDDVLYIAIDGRIVMQDRRERWAQPEYAVPGLSDFNAWRLAADPRGGAWVLDREHKKLARLRGMPLHKLAERRTSSETPAHCEENTDPPRLQLLERVAWPETETPVAIACSQDGEIAVLCWVEDQDSRVRMLTAQRELTAGIQLSGSTHPYSLKWLTRQRIALLLAGINREAPVYRVDSKQSASWPAGDLYPLKRDFNNGPFLHGLHQPPHYPTLDGSRALHRLSFPFYSRNGEAANDPILAPLDGGSANMTWHRLYLEAVIPRGCGIKVWLAATDDLANSVDLPENWYEHRFGRIYATPTRADIPVAVWESMPSELPHHPGLLPCPAQPQQSGLFSVLIQRSTRQVRCLRGRYLKVHVQLTGQGRETPEIFALRAYGERFSYIDEYLPQLYREDMYQPEADIPGDATAADFFARFVTNFEGIFTNLEDRIAHAHLLTDPQSAPLESLPWLGSWIGHEVNQSLPEPVQRNFLLAASELDRWHGTLRGLKLALEIATEGAISGGEIVVLEDFRLRRTFASIIGADLADENDPLTAGASVSGNSFVGDSLFIGDENNREFLALFSSDLPVDTSEQAAIEQLFDRLAHRITILVHQQVEPQDLGLIKQIARQETPAHVEYRVMSASNRFLVGMAALVGVDSYLANRLPPASAAVGNTLLGKNNYIRGPGALDSRLRELGSGAPDIEERSPIAFAPGASVEVGDDIVLDGSESRAFGGRSLTKYNWQYKGEGE
jgi:phage tail-like protein